MVNNQITQNTSKADKSVNIIDLFKYLTIHWKWFVLSVLLFGGYYYYQYSRSTFMYRSSEMVMIKTPMNTPSTARITRTNSAFNSVSVAGEILQLNSKELMRRTIDRLNADVSYVVRNGLRDQELYTQSPVKVTWMNKKADQSYSFTLTPLDNKYVLLKKWSKGDKTKELKIELNKESDTPVGRIVVTAEKHFPVSAFGEDILVTKHAREAMVGYIMGNLKIQQMEEDASLLQITLEDQSIERANDIITMLITVYNEFSLEDKNQIAINTAQFIRERLQIIESELGNVENNIEQLKTANQGVDVNVAGEMYLSESRQHMEERNKLETDIRLVDMMRNHLDNKAKRNELIPGNTGLVEANIENQITDYNTTLLRRNRLVEGSSTENPVVQDLDKALGAMRGNIDRAVENATEGLRVKMQKARSEEQQARGKVIQMPQKQRIMLSVERQQKVKEELYVFLLNKREENALNKAMTDDNIRIIDPASGSDAPIYPVRFKKVMTGVGIGVVLPAAVLLCLLIFNTGVRGRQDIESVLDIPFLGEIPQAGKRKAESNTVLVSKTGRDVLTEAFRIIRTNIGFMSRNGNSPQVITFTSFSIGAGKTFTALNLAATLSFLDKKILILDLDLRKGTISSRVNVKSALGVSHYLANSQVAINDIISKSGIADNIDIIPIGMVAPNPVELLLSKRLDDLVTDLRNKYDYIIVDGVPVGLVADASIVNRISDLTIFMVRVGKMDRRQLPEIEKIRQEGKLSNMSVVLNGLKQGSRGYGYGYG